MFSCHKVSVSSNHNLPGEKHVCAKMGEGCELSSRFIRGFAFPEISRGEFPEKRTTLRDTLNFRKFLTGIFLSIDSPPRNSGIFGSMFRFSEIQQCPDFEETFPSRGNSLPFPHVWKLAELSVDIESISSLLRLFFRSELSVNQTERKYEPNYS